MTTTVSGPFRVGSKKFAAGVTQLTLAVDASTASVIVATIPPGCVILGGRATDDAVVASISDGVSTAVVTTVTAGISVDATGDTPVVFSNPGDIVIVSGNVPSAIVYIDYLLSDDTQGANA